MSTHATRSRVRSTRIMMVDPSHVLTPPTAHGLSERSPTVVDLFCGAGGLSAGLEAAGWTTVAAVDADEDAIATLRASQAAELPIPGTTRRFLAGTKILLRDIRELAARELRPDGVVGRWRPDLLAGGPPCQPFSLSGKMRALDDPRGRLFFDFVRLAEELRPRFVLFENVAGLVTARGPNGASGAVLRLVQRSFEKIGYACRFELINAADFGAAQRRIRLFMIASCSEALPSFPERTHSKQVEPSLFSRMLPWVDLGTFLTTCPPPDPSDIVRPTQRRAREMRSLRPGTGIKATGIVEANRPSGHWGYRQDCFLADPGVPARTIRAASTPDWIRETDGSLRRLTWRECAALQGFPSQWRFHGTLASRFRQIGNAVQGDVAKALGVALMHAAAERRRARPESSEWPANFHKRVRYTEMEEEVNGAHRAKAARQRELSGQA